jgi:glycerophosphoryl diester phosphodiesterase
MLMKPLIVAHRSGDAYSLGNPIRSFEEAIRQGSDIIEFDIFMTKDGKFVVKSSPEIHSMFIWEILSDEHVLDNFLFLEEAIDWGINTETKLMIDIKSFPGYCEFRVSNLLELLRDYGDYVESFAWLASYDHNIVREIKKRVPTLQCGIQFTAYFSDLPFIVRKARADFISTQTRFITREIMDAMHKRRVMICSWTTNNPREILHLLDLGVDLINTDAPNLARDIVDREWLVNQDEY